MTVPIVEPVLKLLTHIGESKPMTVQTEVIAGISTFLTMVERLFLKFYLILEKKLKKEKL